jgi:hypothetical protein
MSRAVFLFISLLIFSSFFAGAQGEFEELADARILPGNPIYPLKIIFENVATSLTFGDENRARREVSLAEKRLSESRGLALRGESEKKIEESLEKYWAHMENAIGIVEEVREKRGQEDADEISRYIKQTGIKHAPMIRNFEGHEIPEGMNEIFEIWKGISSNESFSEKNSSKKICPRDRAILRIEKLEKFPLPPKIGESASTIGIVPYLGVEARVVSISLDELYQDDCDGGINPPLGNSFVDDARIGDEIEVSFIYSARPAKLSYSLEPRCPSGTNLKDSSSGSHCESNGFSTSPEYVKKSTEIVDGYVIYYLPKKSSIFETILPGLNEGDNVRITNLYETRQVSYYEVID